MNESKELTPEDTDAAIAERVMGWKWWAYDGSIQAPERGGKRIQCRVKTIEPPDVERDPEASERLNLAPATGDEPRTQHSYRSEPPRYSTDLTAAFAAVERMREKFGGLGFFCFEIRSHLTLGWSVRIEITNPVFRQTATTVSALPAAICKCLLEAVDALEGKNNG